MHMEMYVGGVDAMEQFQERRARDKTRMDWMDPGRTRIRMQQWCDNQKAQPKWTTNMVNQKWTTKMVTQNEQLKWTTQMVNQNAQQSKMVK